MRAYMTLWVKNLTLRPTDLHYGSTSRANTRRCHQTTARTDAAHAEVSREGRDHRRSRGVAGQQLQYNTRFQSVSNGLRAARVASAASTLLAGAALVDADKQALTDVVSDLREEAAALTDPSSGPFGNEASFAFAGLALSSLPRFDRLPYSTDKAASALQILAERLEKMLGDDPPPRLELETFEELFLNVSNEIGRQLSRPGETIDGLGMSGR